MSVMVNKDNTFSLNIGEIIIKPNYLRYPTTKSMFPLVTSSYDDIVNERYLSGNESPFYFH